MWVGSPTATVVDSRTMKKNASVFLLTSAIVACTEKHASVATEQAASQTTAQALTLTGGKILFDRGGLYERICTGSKAPSSKGGPGCTDLYFYVFPVVPATWGGTEPVPAWVTCSANEKSAEACETWTRSYSGEIRGSVAVRVGDSKKPLRAVSGWETAIEDATKRHTLTAATAGPVLRLGRD